MYSNIGLLALHRSTTVALDEVLCIATFTNLNISKISLLSGEDMVCKVRDLFAAANDTPLPCIMLFLDGSKVIYDYRWALSTLLTPGECFHLEDYRSSLWQSPPRLAYLRGAFGQTFQS